jgi:hypothetical protein
MIHFWDDDGMKAEKLGKILKCFSQPTFQKRKKNPETGIL